MLIAKDRFIGLETVAHLCTGGESPMLKSHHDRLGQFLADKALGEEARARFEAVQARCKQKTAVLLHANPEDITFLSSASDGVNLVAHALNWQPGDNVVIVDVEFPSDVLPWAKLQAKGVEVRVVRHQNWYTSLDAIAAQIDERTRVVNVSLVSYFTGQRLPLKALSELVRSSNALLLVDATHAAGSIDVEASYADILLSSCYKWLLGVHGTAVFYWNRDRLPNLMPPFVGWNTSATLSGWQDPTAFTPRPDADRFIPGNPSFISLYILENALDHILAVGADAIEAHNVHLSGLVHDGVAKTGWELMTPAAAAERAGNVCFMVPDIAGFMARLEAQGVMVWGGYGGINRIRVSTHLYNTEEDVARFLAAL